MPPGEESDRRWLAKPLGPEELRIHVDIGEDVEVSEEARAALDTLLEELYADEVSGFAVPCPDLGACSPRYECIPLGSCSMLSKNPCFADVWCFIRREA
jgi:hypothetical protein